MRALVLGLVVLAGCSARDRDGAKPEVEVEAQPPTLEPAVPPETARKQACLREHVEPARARDQTLVRSLCAEWIEREVPGVALAIAEPGLERPVHVELGVRCFSEPGRVEVDTPFRLGSITKTLTASVALSLVARGELDLDAIASAHVEGFEAPRGLAAPSLGSLLQHRSGLGEIDPEDLVELDGAWLPALARSEPGAAGEYRYSNAGYSLAGAVLVAVAGRDYPTLLTDTLATPLELASLTADPAKARAPACGHLAHDPDRHPIAVTEDLDFMPGDPRWMAPAGGALASASDLARFALALGTQRLPGTAAMLEVGAASRARDPAEPRHRDERYGYGLRSWALADGTRAYGHSGDNVAFRAELMFVPGRRAIVLLANRGTELTASVAAAEALLEAP